MSSTYFLGLLFSSLCELRSGVRNVALSFQYFCHLASTWANGYVPGKTSDVAAGLSVAVADSVASVFDDNAIFDQWTWLLSGNAKVFLLVRGDEKAHTYAQ